MRICLTGPIATADVAHLLDGGGRGLPEGYVGAPLMAVLIGELLRQGHQVVGVSMDRTLRPEAASVVRAKGPGFELVLCPERLRAWRPNGRWPGRALDFWRFERAQLLREVAASGADIVHAHWSYEFALAGLASGLPLVVTCHDSPSAVLRFSRSPYRVVRYLMARHVLQRVKYLTAVSDYMAGEVARLAAADVQVVPNPVASHVYALGRLREVSDRRQIAMIGNGWGRRKNPEAGLLAFAEFRRVVPNATLHCFGNDFGPGERAERWVGPRNLGAGVVFHGAMPHRELVLQLAEMDAVLHPALEESFGVVVAEAMALGLPVLAGRHSGAVAWVLDGQGRSPQLVSPGVLVDVSSSMAISQGLQRLFDRDYGARSAAGLASARSRFSGSAVAAAYLNQYAQVLGLRDLQALEASRGNGAVSLS